MRRFSLKAKTAIVVIGSFSVLLGGFFCLFDFTMMTDFEALEQSSAVRNVLRTEEALNSDANGFLKRVEDQAYWDDAYDFVDSKDKSFISSNLSYDALSVLSFSHIIYFNKKGKPIFGVEVLTDEEKTVPINDDFKSELRTLAKKVEDDPDHRALTGLMKLKQNYYFASVAPILDSNMEKEPNGTLVVLRSFTDRDIESLAARTKLNLKYIKYSEFSSQNDYQISLSKIGSDPYIAYTSEHDMVGLQIVKDIFNQPLYVANVDMHREVYQRGIKSRNFIAMVLLTCLLAASIATILMIEKWVTSRISNLVEDLGAIATSGDHSKRVEEEGNDELRDLSSYINNVLSALEVSQQIAVTAKLAAESANAAKSSFLAKVSHEIRTPLHSILGMLRIIHRGEPDKNRRKYIDLVRVSANTLLSTINDLLDFSKAETGMLDVSMEETELRPILDGALSAISAKVYESGNVELLYEIASDVPKVIMADPHRLQQILVNLLGNSAKFTEFGAVSLVAKYQVDANTITIEVIDSGLGIPEKQIATIFDPFVQVDDKKLKSKGGTGLGLTITKQLIEAMGGSISVTSQVGKGSTFKITLPVHEGYSPPGFERENVFDKKILLISNNPVVNNFYHQSLVSRGAHVTVAPRISGIDDLLKGNHTIVLDDSLLSDDKLLSLVEDIRQQAKVERIMVLINPLRLEIYGILEKLGLKKLHWKPKMSSDLFLSEEQQRRLAIQNKSDVEKALSSETPKLNIIIADDMPTNIIILEELLREAGHNVTTVVNGQLLVEALGIGSKNKPDVKFDLVFTDMQMPVLDGMEALQLIRKQVDSVSKIPVVLVTADGYEEQHKLMRAAGADDVVVKPFDISKLDKIIKKAAEARLGT